MARVRRAQIDGVSEFPAAVAAGDLDSARPVSFVLAEDQQRPLGQQIRHLVGRDVVGVKPLHAHLEVGEHRPLDHVAQFLRLGRGLFGTSHHERLAQPGARHAFDEPTVDRGADAKGKQVGLVQSLADEAEGLRLHAHVAISDHDHGARSPSAQRWNGVGRLQPTHQFGATAAALALDHVQSLADVLFVGRL